MLASQADALPLIPRLQFQEVAATVDVMDEDAALDILTVVGWGALGLVIGAAVSIVVSILARLIVRQRGRLRVLTRRMRIPQRVFLLLLGAGSSVLIATSPALGSSSPPWREIFSHAFLIVMVFASAFLLTGVIRAVEDYVLYRTDAVEGPADESTQETPHARRIRTQMQIVVRVLIAVLWVCALAGALLTFPAFRAVGTSLIASAGLLSIVAGLAAQSSLSNIFAGMQIAFSDALRVGDLVVFDDQMGSVEEITLTYVVVRTWDDRRWIVPSSHFTTEAFENWTRREAQMLGTVEFDLDWLVPVEAMRVELLRLVGASDLWDGRSVNLQVTESTGGEVRIRAVVSAATSGDLWDLRCYVREEMINWLQKHAVYALPRTRLEPDTTTAPPIEEREDFVDQVVGRWEKDQAEEKTQLIPKVDPAVDDDTDEGTLPRWLQSWLVQRRKGHEAPDDTQPAEETPVETTLSSTSPEARLYSGSPEADERGRKLAGPGPADMAEREKTAERKLGTGEQPRIDDLPPAEAAPASEQAEQRERLTETHVFPRISD